MFTILMHAAVGFFFSVWFVLSILNQFGFAWFARVIAFDFFSLLPNWNFFAPNPGHTDYHVVIRDKLPDGSVSEWQELDIAEPRRFLCFLWNPQKRPRKVLVDVVGSLVKSANANPEFEDVVLLSFPYLLVLNTVSRKTRPLASLQRQFIIAETSGFHRTGLPRVILRSQFHLVGASSQTRVSGKEACA
jgi:hypothetical protein